MKSTRPNPSGPAKRRVQFSGLSNVVVIPKDKPSRKYYSRAEHRAFKERAFGTTLRLRTLLQAAHALRAPMPQDAVDECLGLENFVSQDHATRVVQQRNAHSQSILVAQRTHKGDDKADAISLLSQYYSRPSRERAAWLAAALAASCNASEESR